MVLISLVFSLLSAVHNFIIHAIELVIDRKSSKICFVRLLSIVMDELCEGDL